MGVPELRRKRRLARLVSPLSFAERQFRLPILRQRENYTWKQRQEASQKKLSALSWHHHASHP
jgi:hypothetical protein